MAAQEKLTICHKGTTMLVPISDVGEHLDHGDSMGPCGANADFRIDTQFEANTGDSDFDDFLRKTNIVAGGKLTAFISDLACSYDTPKKDVDFLVYRKKMQPADAFMGTLQNSLPSSLTAGKLGPVQR